MIDFAHIGSVGGDLWFDHEVQIVAAQIALFTPDNWATLATELGSQTLIVQDRVAQILGDFNVEPAADILLFLAAANDREIALTAREALRGLSFQVVAASAKRLTASGQPAAASSLKYKSINAILDAIEARSLQPNAA
jgi:hypothetical protein